MPVEYKNTMSDRGRPWPDHKYQLTAYALLVEENHTTLVKRGYVSYLPEDFTLKIDITPYMKTQTVNSITEVIDIIRKGKLPP